MSCSAPTAAFVSFLEFLRTQHGSDSEESDTDYSFVAPMTCVFLALAGCGQCRSRFWVNFGSDRDGAPADAMMLYSMADARMRRQFIEEEGGSEDHRRREHKRLDALLAYCEATQCRRIALLAYFGEGGAEACGAEEAFSLCWRSWEHRFHSCCIVDEDSLGFT